MTATATKVKPSRALAKLQERLTEAFARLNEVKRERAAYDAETESQRAHYTAYVNQRPEDWRDEARNPKPGSLSGDVAARLKARMSEGNPRQADFDSAVAEFHEADEAIQRFRRGRMAELIEEIDPEYRAIVDRFRSALEEIVETESTYRALIAHVMELIRECSAIDGRALAFDPRPSEWRQMAEAALERDVTRPGISESRLGS